MPATDILNPDPHWEEDIQDSMCPDYGFTRKRAATQSNKKAVGGVPYSREMQNTGHTFNFSWLARSYACIQRLKRYYEQYEDGFFTMIDHDAGGRHYVGRFTSEVIPTETGNGTWDAQNVTFEEIPIVPMVKYPNDWQHDAIWLYPQNDYGDQKLVTSGTWTYTQHVIGAKDVFTFDNPGTTVGDWAQHEYRGYGFILLGLKGPSQGVVTVQLDGVTQQSIDCYAAAQSVQPIFKRVNISLDFHRVKVLVEGNGSTIGAFTRNSGATAGAIAASWYALQVMR